MMAHRWLLLLIANLGQAAIFGTITPAANYYVDKVGGSDSNNGTSSATPFQTLSKLQSVISTGKLAAIYSGATQYRYQEAYTVPAAHIGTVGWGPTQPLIDCSQERSGGAWSKTGGLTNVYQATVTVDNQLGFIRLWEDNVSFPRASSLANLDATASTYYVSGDPSGGGTTSFTLYVHASDSGNPASNEKVYEYNARGYALFSSFDYNLASNLAMRRSLTYAGPHKAADYSQATDLLLEDGNVHNATVGGGGYWRYVHLKNSYAANLGRIALVIFDPTATGQNFTLDTVSYTETIQTGSVGFFSHDSNGGAYGLISLLNCSTAAAPISAISGFNSAAMLVSGGSFDGSVGLASAVSSINNATISGQVNIPYGGTITIGNSTITAASANGAVYVSAGLVLPLYLSIHDSTISNSTAFSNAIGLYDTPTTYSLLNNTFPWIVQTNYFGGPGSANIPVLSPINGNIYHYSGTATGLNYRGTFYNISLLTGWNLWRALGFDATGSRVTP